jgi:Methyltransferase domain
LWRDRFEKDRTKGEGLLRAMGQDWDQARLQDRTDEFQSVLDEHARKTTQRFAQMAVGIAARLCPLCDYYGNFGVFGAPPRFDARCPSCASLERHRLIWLAIRRRGLLGPEHVMLHFSAEHPLRVKIKPLVGRYETAEIRADIKPDHVIDIEATGLPDACYDRIMCNHVLEHVDDARALAEIYRMLRPGGVAILTTPVVEGWAETYENPRVQTPLERLLHFGQEDHARFFGRDLRDRIKATGFALDEVVATEPDVHRFGLIRAEAVFIATKPEGRA